MALLASSEGARLTGVVTSALANGRSRINTALPDSSHARVSAHALPNAPGTAASASMRAFGSTVSAGGSLAAGSTEITGPSPMLGARQWQSTAGSASASHPATAAPTPAIARSTWTTSDPAGDEHAGGSPLAAPTAPRQNLGVGASTAAALSAASATEAALSAAAARTMVGSTFGFAGGYVAGAGSAVASRYEALQDRHESLPSTTTLPSSPLSSPAQPAPVLDGRASPGSTTASAGQEPDATPAPAPRHAASSLLPAGFMATPGALDLLGISSRQY